MANRKRKLRAYRITVSRGAASETYLISALMEIDATTKAQTRFAAAHATGLSHQPLDSVQTVVEELDA